MENVKVGICEPEDFSEKAIARLEEFFEVEKFCGGSLKEFIESKDVIFVRLGYRYDDELIAKESNLRYICSPTTGLNHIVVDEKKKQIISLKGEQDFLESIRATPEHVFGLSIALLRNYSHAFRTPMDRSFDRDSYKGFELYNNKVGIIGMGRIGKLLTRYYKAFDAEVLYYEIDETVVNPDAYRCNSIQELIDKSNIIILEANYSEKNHNMIDKVILSRMKGKYFINAARGELVDENALIELLEQDIFAGVAIDVLGNENSSSRTLDRLLSLVNRRNVIVTPHIGGATYTSMRRTEEFIVEKLIKIIGEENAL